LPLIGPLLWARHCACHILSLDLDEVSHIIVSILDDKTDFLNSPDRPGTISRLRQLYPFPYSQCHKTFFEIHPVCLLKTIDQMENGLDSPFNIIRNLILFL
jgi:hypothetical protein